MKVTLISVTPEARELLIFSKRTRLLNSAEEYETVKALSEEEKTKELEYVLGTIGSSLEFVDYVFLIEGVTRAFTHQLVRHRVGVSFAQQSQRTVDVSKSFDYLATGKCEGSLLYHSEMKGIKLTYENLVKQGCLPQDARGILPTNILNNILMKINLRSLSGLLGTRLCYRVQGEFRQVAEAIKHIATNIHPWVEPILRVHCAQHGVCLFKDSKGCPLKRYIKNATTDELDKINSMWRKLISERSDNA